MSVNFNVDLSTADNQRDLFEKLAQFDEVFNQTCEKCKNKGKSGDNLKFQVREIDGNKFYEIICLDCGARLSFGSHKTGNTLFPKRKDGDEWLPDRGWVRWNKETGKNE